jgi:hypothetical protein
MSSYTKENWLPDHKVQEMVEENMERYFVPNRCYDMKELVQADLERGIKCSICQMIPFQLQKCIKCSKAYCSDCAHDIQTKSSLEDRLCECTKPSENQFVNMFRALKVEPYPINFSELICMLKAPHCCEHTDKSPQELDGENDSSTPMMEYNIEDLREHLQHDCPKSRTCKECQKTFESVEEYKDHLKKYCDHVEVQCNHCNYMFQRSQLPDHLCPDPLPKSAGKTPVKEAVAV